MSLLSVAARDASLDNDYGATHGPHAPASHLLALFTGDPSGTGVEVSGGGYARVSLPNDATTWAGAAGGATVSKVVTFPASTGPWTPATHWVLYAPDGTAWDGGVLTSEVGVAAPGVVVSLTVTVYYASED